MYYYFPFEIGLVTTLVICFHSLARGYIHILFQEDITSPFATEKIRISIKLIIKIDHSLFILNSIKSLNNMHDSFCKKIFRSFLF